MTENDRRITIDLDKDTYRALQRKAIERSCSITDLAYAAIRQSIAEDGDSRLTSDNRLEAPELTDEEMFTRLQEDGWLF